MDDEGGHHMSDRVPVQVATISKGVFFGYAELPPDDAPMPVELTLYRARMATYWPNEQHGALTIHSLAR